MRTLLALLLVAGLATADKIVLRDKTILEGTAKAAADDGKITIGARTLKPDEILLWVDGEGKPINTPTFVDQMRAYDAINDVTILERCREFIPAAIEAKAGGSARALLAEAERLGMPADEVDALSPRVLATPPDKTDAAYDLHERKEFATLLAQQSKANGALKGKLRGLELLRAALVRDEQQKSALEILETVAPGKRTGRRRRRRRQTDEQKKAAAAQRRVWLDWQVDVLPSKFGRIRLLNSGHPEMQRAKELWRPRNKDTGQRGEPIPIHGIETEEIVFLTPMEKTAIVKMCVSIARTNCRALEKLFATDEPKRGTTDPLVIYFYRNQKEYIELSGEGRGTRPSPMIAMSAGHYISTENVSRFFWPNRPGAAESVRETFVHELTHHWIQERNPRWSRANEAQGALKVTTPGVWIVEGIAVFMQEGRFDLKEGTWSHFNPHCLALDSVAAIAKMKLMPWDRRFKWSQFDPSNAAAACVIPVEKLMPWERLFTITKMDLSTNVETGKIQAHYKGKWNLRPIPMSEMLLFYKQSGSACQFLYWGESGKYREKLKDYVTAYYTGDKKGTDLQTAFGMTPDELGTKVEVFAQKVVDGWRPPSEK